jgi:hypothetical protein
MARRSMTGVKILFAIEQPSAGRERRRLRKDGGRVVAKRGRQRGDLSGHG